MATGIYSVHYFIDLDGIINGDESLEALPMSSWTLMSDSSSTSTDEIDWTKSAMAPVGVTSGMNSTTNELPDGTYFIAPGQRPGAGVQTPTEYPTHGMGSYSVYLRVEDYAGNVEYYGAYGGKAHFASQMQLRIVSKGRPTISYSPTAYSYHTNSSDYFTFTLQDTGSGIKLAHAFLYVDVRDGMGNLIAQGSGQFENFLPLISQPIQVEYYVLTGERGNYTKTKVVKTVQPSELVTSIPYEKVVCRISIADLQNLANDLEPGNFAVVDGQYRLEIRCGDYDGNTSQVESVSFMFDTIKPSLTVTIAEESVGNMLQYADTPYVGDRYVLKHDAYEVTFGINSTDINGVTVDMMYQRPDGSTRTYEDISLEEDNSTIINKVGKYTFRDFTDDGEYIITFVAKDRYGISDSDPTTNPNESLAITYKVCKDTAKPQMNSISLSPNILNISPNGSGSNFSISMKVQDR